MFYLDLLSMFFKRLRNKRFGANQTNENGRQRHPKRTRGEIILQNLNSSDAKVMASQKNTKARYSATEEPPDVDSDSEVDEASTFERNARNAIKQNRKLKI